VSWASALADHLDHGGPMDLCATCHQPHAVSLVVYRGAVGIITEAAVDAAIGRLEAVLDGRRPEDCACRCCAEVGRANERALDAQPARPTVRMGQQPVDGARSLPASLAPKGATLNPEMGDDADDEGESADDQDTDDDED